MSAAGDSFGRVFPASGRVVAADRAIALLQEGRAAPGSFLAHGNGRSYGDTCLNAEGAVIDMRPRKAILSFDPASGLMEAEAGVLLSEIIAHVAPHGFFPFVVPGTEFVTLGGAVANDIHGKNHHRRGTFGRHVESFELLRSDGRTVRCSRSENANLFAATIGGMGLTGLILSAKLRLMPVPSLGIREEVRRFSGLGEYFDMAGEADAGNEYAVAWVDQLAAGGKAGRGLLMTGNHAEAGPVRSGGRLPLSVPFQPPLNLLNRPFLTLFNAAYEFAKGRKADARVVGHRSFFFPLDGVRNWNRLYGPQGLFQHQSVIPEDEARKIVPRLLEASRAAGQASFLTVLKRFGDLASPGVLSFPRPGYTLTLDFPNRGKPTLDLLERLDRMTVEAGGAVNPYKDARMSAVTFANSSPRWRQLEAERDPAFLSDFWRRTALRLAATETRLAAE